MAATGFQAKLKRLRPALEDSRKRLKLFRDERLDTLSAFVGKHYGANATDNGVKKRPVNYINMFTRVYTRALAARAPKVMVHTDHKTLRSPALMLELATNHLLADIRLEGTLQRMVQHALFSIGIVKVGLKNNKPWAGVIDFDDWVHDVAARDMEEAKFKGNRYRMPLDKAKTDTRFTQSIREKLTAQTNSQQGGNDDGASKIGIGKQEIEEKFIEYVEFYDLYLPEDNLIVTLPADCSYGLEDGYALRVAKWEGPYKGPFHTLGYTDVPNNAMPLAPILIIKDLDELANSVERKKRMQAERQKEVLLVRKQNASDGNKIQKADDGDIYTVDDPSASVSVKFGGVDQGITAFSMQLKDMVSWFGGNLDTLAGLSPQADTLGQEQLLNGATSKTVQDMMDQTSAVAKRIVRDLSWYLFTDPEIELPLMMPIGDSGVEIPVRFTPEERRGTFFDYNFEIEPYSMQHDSPQARVQAINNVLTTLQPWIPMMQQQGLMLDVAGLMKVLSRYLNIKELDEFIINMPPNLIQQMGPVGQPPAKAANTTRNYVRTNKSANGSQQLNNAALIAGFASGQGSMPKAAPMPAP